MKSLKSTKGFTLVELIVVIAILGILAAVAVPAYSGYITKAKEASDYTQLDAIKTAVIFAATEHNAKSSTQVDASKITVTNGSATIKTGTVDITPYYDIVNFKFESSATKAEWTEGGSWVLTYPSGS